VAGIAVAGIIGNRSDAGFVWAWSNISTPFLIPLWVLILIFLFLLLIPAIFLVRFYNAHQLATKLNELDGTLWLLISSLDLNPDREEALGLLVEKFLEDTLKLFADGCRISILRPNTNTPDYLTVWRSSLLPSETVKRLRFYIGSDNEKQRGVAGHTFMDNQLRVVHLFKQDNIWHADDPDYRFFVKRPKPSYLSFVAVPIINNNKKCMAVLCIDSNSKTAFDAEKVQELLLALGRRLAAAMQIAQKS
jgi:hypothetical protein